MGCGASAGSSGASGNMYDAIFVAENRWGPVAGTDMSWRPVPDGRVELLGYRGSVDGIYWGIQAPVGMVVNEGETVVKIVLEKLNEPCTCTLKVKGKYKYTAGPPTDDDLQLEVTVPAYKRGRPPGALFRVTLPYVVGIAVRSPVNVLSVGASCDRDCPKPPSLPEMPSTSPGDKCFALPRPGVWYLTLKDRTDLGGRIAVKLPGTTLGPGLNVIDLSNKLAVCAYGDGYESLWEHDASHYTDIKIVVPLGSSLVHMWARVKPRRCNSVVIDGLLDLSTTSGEPEWTVTGGPTRFEKMKFISQPGSGVTKIMIDAASVNLRGEDRSQLCSVGHGKRTIRLFVDGQDEPVHICEAEFPKMGESGVIMKVFRDHVEFIRNVCVTLQANLGMQWAVTLLIKDGSKYKPAGSFARFAVLESSSSCMRFDIEPGEQHLRVVHELGWIEDEMSKVFESGEKYTWRFRRQLCKDVDIFNRCVLPISEVSVVLPDVQGLAAKNLLRAQVDIDRDVEDRFYKATASEREHILLVGLGKKRRLHLPDGKHTLAVDFPLVEGGFLGQHRQVMDVEVALGGLTVVEVTERIAD